MKKTVLTFGLISGAIVSVLMLAVLPFHDRIGLDLGMLVGYTSMVLAFLMTYFGVRSYRDNVAGGQVTFGRAFKVGLISASGGGSPPSALKRTFTTSCSVIALIGRWQTRCALFGTGAVDPGLRPSVSHQPSGDAAVAVFPGSIRPKSSSFSSYSPRSLFVTARSW